MTFDPVLQGAFVGFLGAAGFAATGAGIYLRRKARNGNGHGNGNGIPTLTSSLGLYIDERAAHKANGAVAHATLQTSELRRELHEFKSDTSGRFDAVDEKMDRVDAAVGQIGRDFAYLRGKIGE